MRFTLSHGVRIGAVVAVLALAATGGHVRAAMGGLQSGIDLSNLDRTCKPCSDFYQFANGGWIKNNPIPAAYPGISNFQKLADRNTDVLHGILDGASAANAAPGSNEQKIGDFYASCMNVAAIDAAGTKPIADLLAAASSVDPTTLATTLARLQTDGVGTFFAFYAGSDNHNSSMNIAQLRQSGLGLPDRDYYLKDDAKTTAIRDAYVAHVAKMFQLIGDSPDTAAKESQTVLAVETTLAQNSFSRVQNRDPYKTYNKMTFAQLQTLVPGLNWNQYFAQDGVSDASSINVVQPSFFKALAAQLSSMSSADLHTYLRWHVVHSYASDLSQPFVDENFNFYSKTLQGTTAQLPRWKTCVRKTDGVLGEALGQFYVAKTFPPAAKAQALAMVKNVKQTLRDDFSTLDWMSPQTRTRAVAKLDAFMLKIGYPDKWQDYTKLPIVRDSLGTNMLADSRYESARDYARIGKPVDRAEWGMTPPTVNAYYDPTVNEIVFPAGILQPPYYNKDADMAVNYGGMGAVIGHESTHGFDDEGRHFDLHGNLVDWWAPADSTRFNARAQCMVDQWNALSPQPGVHEVGQQVLGEEIADLGGMTIAYKAFEKWQAHHPRRTIDGFSPEQRFFMGWAQVWASQYRPETIALRAKTDVHGYDKFRVNATLADMPGFAQAFFCKLNDPMVRPPKTRCQIW
ncbi:MAG TPA: M13 family metallopeptidase [Candidatus Baltobacteraceae bacterium]|jgi:putative endopeptidase